MTCRVRCRPRRWRSGFASVTAARAFTPPPFSKLVSRLYNPIHHVADPHGGVPPALRRRRGGRVASRRISPHAQPVPRDGPVPRRAQAVGRVPPPTRRRTLPVAPTRPGRPLPRAHRRAPVPLRTRAFYINHSRRPLGGVHRD